MEQRRLPGGTSRDGRVRLESAEHPVYSGIPEGAAESVFCGSYRRLESENLVV